MPKRPAEERFAEKVNKTETCWLWIAGRDTEGYGMFFDGRLMGAHRWSYQYHVGPIPKGLHLDHLCRVRNCVNPDHLEPVTPAENARRMPRSPTCPRGHEFTPANTQLRMSHGYITRFCLACQREWSRERRARQRLAS